MCPSITMDMGYAVSSPQWRERTKNAVSLASRAASAASGSAVMHFRMLSLAKDLWGLDRILRNMLEGVYKEASSGSPSRIPTNEEVLNAVDALRNLHSVVEKMYQRAKSGGLTNRAIVGAAFNSVHVRADEILDLAESVEVALNPAVDAYFDRALADLKNGEVFDLSAFK